MTSDVGDSCAAYPYCHIQNISRITSAAYGSPAPVKDPAADLCRGSCALGTCGHGRRTEPLVLS